MSVTPSARLFTQTAAVLNPTRAQSSDGSELLTYSSSSSYSCSIQPVSASERLAMGRDLAETISRGFFPVTATVNIDARVAIGSTTYRCIGPARDGAGKGRYVEVLLLTEATTNV